MSWNDSVIPKGKALLNGSYTCRSWWNQRSNLIHRPGQSTFNQSYLPRLSSQSSQVGFSRRMMLKLDLKNRPNNPSPIPQKEAFLSMLQSFFLKWTETLRRQMKWIASFDGFYLQSKCTSLFSRKAVKMSWLNMKSPRWFFGLSSEIVRKWPPG